MFPVGHPVIRRLNIILMLTAVALYMYLFIQKIKRKRRAQQLFIEERDRTLRAMCSLGLPRVSRETVKTSDLYEIV